MLRESIYFQGRTNTGIHKDYLNASKLVLELFHASGDNATSKYLS
jgi:hypothetical protein